MDNDKQLIQQAIPISLGKKAIIDLNTNKKIIKYSSILADQFQNTCSFYYKNIDISSKFQALNVNIECCFIFSVTKKQHTLCNHKKHHCKFETL